MDNLAILEIVYDGNDLYGSRTCRIVDILQKHGLYHGRCVDGIYADFLTPANVPAGTAGLFRTAGI